MKVLKNVSFFVLVFLILGFSSILFAQAPASSAEDEVIALTYKIWKAENEKDMATRNKYISDDYTEFNPSYSTRIDGKTKNFNLSDASFSNGTSLADELLNPKVQVYGDVAILTYNFAGVIKDNDGKVRSSKAKSTRVYVKMNGDWKLVHANFGSDPTTDN
jgi:ketosteroid isomerase-like protein